MKRLFLSIIAIIAITTSSVFGAYGSGDIDQLQDPDVLKVEFLSLGVLAGSETIRFAVSLNSDLGASYLSLGTNNVAGDSIEFGFDGSVYAGVGYKTPAFGAWLGYEFGYDASPGIVDSAWMWHSPHLQFTALDNTFRINIPITIGVGVTDNKGVGSTSSIEGVVALSTAIESRYYTQIEYLTQIRFYVNYGQFDYSKAENAITKELPEHRSLGFQARFYFNIPNDGPVTVEPIVKMGWNGVLGPNSATAVNRGVVASGYVASSIDNILQDGDPTQDVFVTLALGLSAGNDIVSIYVEPYIGLESAIAYREGDNSRASDQTGINVGNYMEIYLYPTPALQVYLELDTGYNTANPAEGDKFTLGTATGVKWFF